MRDLMNWKTMTTALMVETFTLAVFTVSYAEEQKVKLSPQDKHFITKAVLVVLQK